jgi:hypothetical protein
MMQAQPPHTTLAAMRDKQRAVVVFANGNNALAEQQLQVAAQHAADFRERDLLLVGIEGTDPSVPTAMLKPDEDAAARRRFHVEAGQFTVVLIGKDGGEKLRSHTPFTWQTLRDTMDSMPMRAEEMRQRR